MNPISDFILSQYRITFQPEDKIIVPQAGKGNVIRGAFGSTLKRLCCINQDSKNCGTCGNRSACPYHLIFNPIGLVKQKRFGNAPRGFVVKPPLDTNTEYIPENPFIFDIVLIGRLIEYIPWIIVPFNELGRHGIGKNRGSFILSGIGLVIDGKVRPLYDSKTGIFSNHDDFITGETILEKAKKLPSDHITLEFLTPTRIKFNPTGKKAGSVVIRDPEFHHIIRRLVSRISALSSAYLDRVMEIDYRSLIGLAINIKKKDTDLKWVELKRKSRTGLDRFGQHATHDQSGFKGKITFEGDLTEFLPLLLLGEYIHVGEDAVFGNGWYRILE